MADMNPKDFNSEIEEMMDGVEPAVAPHSNSSNHFEDQVRTDDIKAMLKDIKKPPLLTTSCCIYKAPPLMRQAKEDAFTPRIISIGPLHHGNQRLRNMETHKHVFFKEFVEEAEISLDDLVSFVNNLEPRVRACYSEDIELSMKDLVRMILVDAGFIIKLFLKYHYADDDLMSKLWWLLNSVEVDLLLLENQLPFFLLEEIFNQAFPSLIRDGRRPSFQNLTFDFFSNLNTQKLDPEKDFIMNHFTDLSRFFYLQKDKPDIKSIDIADVTLYRASMLEEAGMKFKASKSKCLLDLKFSGGVLEIPHITVDEDSEILFLNMLALEQCHYPRESYFGHYGLLLKGLIETSKDVDVLVKGGIISNYLADSNEVAQLFNNKLGKHFWHVRFNSDYYDICKKLNRFYKNPWNNMKATLRRDYCKTPWQIAASIAGIVLLILTLLQTMFSIIK